MTDFKDKYLKYKKKYLKLKNILTGGASAPPDGAKVEEPTTNEFVPLPTPLVRETTIDIDPRIQQINNLRSKIMLIINIVLFKIHNIPIPSSVKILLEDNKIELPEPPYNHPTYDKLYHFVIQLDNLGIRKMIMGFFNSQAPEFIKKNQYEMFREIEPKMIKKYIDVDPPAPAGVGVAPAP